MKKIKYGFVLTIISIVLALSITSSFFILNNQKKKLTIAESHHPESAISTYFKQIKNNNFDNIFDDSLKVESHLNSKKDYIEALKNIYKDVDIQKLNYIKSEDNLYQIVYDNKLISSLRLIKSNDSEYIVSTIFTSGNDYIIQAPSDITIMINENELDNSYIIENNVVASNFLGLTNTSDSPKVNTYEIKNLINEPEISTKESGYSVIKDVLNDYYYVGKIASNNLDTIFENAAKAVAKYPTKDGGLSSIPAITNSDFYNRIKTLDNQWYAPHGISQFSNINVNNVIMQSDNSMIGNITMDYLISSSSASKNYHIGYQITFLNISNTWKIAGFAIDNDLNPLNKEE